MDGSDCQTPLREISSELSLLVWLFLYSRRVSEILYKVLNILAVFWFLLFMTHYIRFEQVLLETFSLVASSKVESDGCNAEVFLLLEFVLQSWEELRVDFTGELLHIIDCFLQVLLLVAGPLFHLWVPGIDLLDSLCTQDEGGRSYFRVGMLQQERIEQRDLT